MAPPISDGCRGKIKKKKKRTNGIPHNSVTWTLSNSIYVFGFSTEAKGKTPRKIMLAENVHNDIDSFGNKSAVILWRLPDLLNIRCFPWRTVCKFWSNEISEKLFAWIIFHLNPVRLLPFSTLFLKKCNEMRMTCYQACQKKFQNLYFFGKVNRQYSPCNFLYVTDFTVFCYVIDGFHSLQSLGHSCQSLWDGIFHWLLVWLLSPFHGHHMSL